MWEEIVQHAFRCRVAVHQSGNICLRLQFQEYGSLPFEQAMSERDKGFQEVFVEMEERDVVRTQYRRDESSDVGLSDDFLLRWLEHLYGDRIDECCVSTVHLAGLSKEIFESVVGLAVFVVRVPHDVLYLCERILGNRTDELGCL